MAFVVTKTRGPRARRAGHQGRRNATKALGNSQGVIETCLWVRFGSLDCLDLVSFELGCGGWRQKEPNRCAKDALKFIGFEEPCG